MMYMITEATFGFHALFCVILGGSFSPTTYGFTDIVSMLLDNHADFESLQMVMHNCIVKTHHIYVFWNSVV